MDEHMRKKDMARIQDDAMKQEEARMMAKLNGTSQPINLNNQTMLELDEHMREKEMARIKADADAMKQLEARMGEKDMARIKADADAMKQLEARMMAKLNGTFDYSSNEYEEVGRKRRKA